MSDASRANEEQIANEADAAESGAGKAGRPAGESENIKETLQSILIAFVLAFVFRSFVVEAFVIPTGSMAPTLLGKHVRFLSPETGYDFTVNPAQYRADIPDEPRRLQTASAEDPMSGLELQALNEHLRSGDRILVLKYIYALFEPERFDVIVFKNPNYPAQNYIKRLIGLPNEDVWLVDGDVFARPHVDSDALQDGWRIERKPMHVQREVWQPVFHSQFLPLNPQREGQVWFTPRWRATSGEWQIDGRSSYLNNSSGESVILFDPPGGITDYTTFDQTAPSYRTPHFNVADVRVAAGIKPAHEGLSTTISLNARNSVFQAVIRDGEALVQMRPEGESDWQVLQRTEIDPLPAGRISNVEFWHVDQSLWLWVDGRKVAHGEYNWLPGERFAAATGTPIEEALERERLTGSRNMLERSLRPEPAQLSWSFDGSPLELFRVEVDRDLYYRPASYSRTGRPAMATHPNNIATLEGDQFFALGDNSALSLDARLWDPPEQWVAHRVDPDQGVVNRSMLLGKAFFVYWPSMQPFRDRQKPLVPDFGRMRFIR